MPSRSLQRRQLSRSKIELFIACPRCFWLDVARGIPRPSGPPFTLNNAGFTATAIETEARLTMDTVDGKPTITAVHLMTRAQVPDIAAAQFAEIASNAKVNCVVSRALAPAITVTMDASLAS